MGKRVHYNTPCHAHELTFGCYKHRPFLTDDLYCQYLSDAIQSSRVKYSFSVWAYVFMPNHVHLLIYPTQDNYNIPEITQSIKQSVSRRVLNRARKSGVEALGDFQTNSKTHPYRFWQSGGGYDRNIVSGNVLRKSIEYIHNNPIRAELVKSPNEWKWSSYLDWSDKRIGPVDIDTTNMLPI